ncbi:hypothetical protein Taro_016066 [Colocasia esculenta]|uniref:Uncharacterized protein n=1 Tax=Colocasia esculenta TaxID=4460 RepID=A0A843UP32_COLES|nr:hypothetical protein [Colocasia esculenta]
MVRGGCSGRGSTLSNAPSTSVGRGSTPIGSASPTMSVVSATRSASPTTPVVPATDIWSASRPVASPVPSHSAAEVERHHPAAKEVAQPARRQLCWISGGGTCSQDRRISLEYESSESLLPRQILESRCGRPGTRQRRPQATRILRRHELERAPTFRELFDRNHKCKGTDDYVSKTARTIFETYDRTMADCYVEGTPQPDLDPEAWVDAAGGPRKGQVYDFGDSRDTTLVLSSYASLVAPPAYASSSAMMPGSGGEDIRTLIREELQQHLGAMVEQVVVAIRGAGPS